MYREFKIFVHFFRKFIIKSLIYNSFTFFLANSTGIQCLIREFNHDFTVCFANSLSIPRIDYLFGEFTMNLVSFWQFTMGLREFTMNSLPVSRIHYLFREFIIFLANLLWIYFEFWRFTIDFREITMNLLFSREFTINTQRFVIHYEFTILFANLI